MALFWPLTLLLATKSLLDLGVPAPRAPSGGCPADARVEVNLPAWKAALEQADTEQRRDELLGQVKLSLDLPETDSPSPRTPRLVVAGVEDAAVALEADTRAAHVLQVSYRVDGTEDATTIHLVQVLRALEGRAYCAVGEALVRGEEPGARVSYALTFVPLVDTKSKVIQVERARVEARDHETRREYWIVRASKLQKIFDEATSHMRSDAGGGATTTTVGTISLSGGFPKRIELTEATKRGGCEVRAGDTPCDDSPAATTTKTTFVYDGTKYVRRK